MADPTDEQVEAFRAAWRQADTEGDEGNRVRRGLAAAGLTAASVWDAAVASLRYSDGSAVEVITNDNPYR